MLPKVTLRDIPSDMLPEGHGAAGSALDAHGFEIYIPLDGKTPRERVCADATRILTEMFAKAFELCGPALAERLGDGGTAG